MRIISLNAKIKDTDNIEVERLLEMREEEIKECIVVVVVDSNIDDNLNKYYNAIKKVIMIGGRPIIIMLSSRTRSRLQIGSLMMLYQKYDIYVIEDDVYIDRGYIDKIISREPGIEEVATFIGGDIAAFDGSRELVANMIDCIHSGDIIGLQEYIKDNLERITGLIDVIDYLKMNSDYVNSGGFINNIDKLQDNLKKQIEENSVLNSDNESKKKQITKLTNDLAEMDRERQAAQSKYNEVATKLNTSTSMNIKTYNEINTDALSTKIKYILYFKEFSHVTYVNTVIDAIYLLAKQTSKKVKVLIYDTKSGYKGIYEPLSQVSSDMYLGAKQLYINKIEVFVVIEPNEIILRDILNNSSGYDLLIVIDKLRQKTDLVKGAIVSKYYIAATSKEVSMIRKEHTVLDNSIITNEIITDKNEFSKCLYVPKIEGIRGAGDTMKIMKIKSEVPWFKGLIKF